MMQGIFKNHSTQDNALRATWALLRALSLHRQITRSSVESHLLSHPEYPSLQSVSDVLTQFKIENAAFKLELAQLQSLPCPMLVHLRTKQGIFGVITHQQTDTLTYTDGSATHTLSVEEFSKQWTGIVLIAEPSSSAGEVNYAAKRKQERWKHLRLPALAALGTLIPLGLVLLSPSAFSWFWVGLFLLKLLGLGLGTALLSLHIVGKQSFASSFCQLGDKSDCNAILNSPAAMLWGLISWAEIGFLYYAGGLLCLLLALVSAHPLGVVPFLSVLSWLALPYPIFSVYYQWRIAKQWCPLCLAVQGVLVAEALLHAVRGLPLEWVSPLAATGVALLGFGLVLAGWLLAKPLWLNSLQLRKTKRELSKFKHNPEVFEQFLRQQPAMPPLTPALKALRLGATEAEAQHTLVVVTNPYCGPCAKAHQQLEELMAIHPDLSIYLIITTCYSIRNRQVAAHWLALQTYDFEQALHNWYNQTPKSYETWAEQYPVTSTSGYEKQLDSHCEWTHNANIKGTPTFYFDGFLLPNQYRLEDLSTLLMTLTSDFEKSL